MWHYYYSRVSIMVSDGLVSVWRQDICIHHDDEGQSERCTWESSRAEVVLNFTLLLSINWYSTWFIERLFRFIIWICLFNSWCWMNYYNSMHNTNGIYDIFIHAKWLIYSKKGSLHIAVYITPFLKDTPSKKSYANWCVSEWVSGKFY